ARGDRAAPGEGPGGDARARALRSRGRERGSGTDGGRGAAPRRPGREAEREPAVSRILLAAGASAALHKACDLASQLAQDGHTVRALLTPRAAELVHPQLFEALTGEPASVREFGDARRSGMDH